MKKLFYFLAVAMFTLIFSCEKESTQEYPVYFDCTQTIIARTYAVPEDDEQELTLISIDTTIRPVKSYVIHSLEEENTIIPEFEADNTSNVGVTNAIYPTLTTYTSTMVCVKQ